MTIDEEDIEEMERCQAERDEYVPKKLMEEYEFTQKTADRLWLDSRTRRRIERAKSMVCKSDFDYMLQDRLVFMWPSDAYKEMYFEMIGSSAWMDIP